MSEPKPVIPTRIFVSCPLDDHLEAKYKAIKHGFLQKLISQNYTPYIFDDETEMSWNYDSLVKEMKCCQAAVVLSSSSLAIQQRQ